MDNMNFPVGNSASSRPNSWMGLGVQVDKMSDILSSSSGNGNVGIINHNTRSTVSPPLYTWSTNLDEELSTLTRGLSLTDPCDEAGTKELMGRGFDRSEVNDFSANGIETDLTAYDEYQYRLRRNYTLVQGNSAVNDDQRVNKGNANNLKMYRSTVCVFCKNNGENLSVYGTHTLKDQLGLVSCPILQRYTCPVCGASGPRAHTLKYCPYNTNYRPSSTRNGKSRPNARKHRHY
ncbi:uncharacterized protein LOC135467141 [Liolophura sinensis]|uniref:uncharacterized protein LOC135467141 n=1 Tax=Liolophura sinensis TaxID=3198878 RepID=UPI003159249E